LAKVLNLGLPELISHADLFEIIICCGLYSPRTVAGHNGLCVICKQQGIAFVVLQSAEIANNGAC